MILGVSWFRQTSAFCFAVLPNGHRRLFLGSPERRRHPRRASGRSRCASRVSRRGRRPRTPSLRSWAACWAAVCAARHGSGQIWPVFFFLIDPFLVLISCLNGSIGLIQMW